MKPVFRDDSAREKMVQWFDRFRAKIPVTTQSLNLSTRFGRTHVLVGGPDGGAPIVVLHGALASSAHVMVELAPLLAKYRVYAVDVVGQSPMSALVRPSVSNDDYGLWLGDVLDGLSLSKARVIGVSWGAFVAIRFASIAPERVERLALVVPAGIVNGSTWKGITKLAIPMALYRMRPSTARRDAFLSNLLTTHDDDWAPYLGDAFLSFNMDMRVPKLAKPSELAAFRAPTLVLGGDSDLSFPGRRLLDRSAILFPNLVEGELIEGCRHCPPTSDAFRLWLAQRLDRFFDDTAQVPKIPTASIRDESSMASAR